MKILYVEGADDKGIIEILLKKAGLNAENINIQSKGGKTEVLKTISIEISKPQNLILGCVIDADSQKIEDAKASVLNRLKNGGYKSTNYEGKGFILSTDRTNEYVPKVGFWIMPNNDSHGKIEDFLLNGVSENDPLIAIAKQAIQQVIEKIPENQRFKEKDTSKALVLTYLAWQTQPTDDLKVALKAKMLNPNAVLTQDFIEWLQALFS
jgi:hypothetical protein